LESLAVCPKKAFAVATIRVLIADDHPGVVAELRTRIGKFFEIVGAVEDGKQAVDAALRLAPDVLVLDVSMPVMNGFQTAACLRDLKCRTKIVILTVYEDSEYVSAAFSSGARAYVTKQHLGTDLVTAIHEVLHGNTFISPSLQQVELPPRA
jgi:DNA-binding NarL/FixJ family response regulator